MCMGVLPACMSVHYVLGSGQKKATESLGLELQMVVSCHEGVGTGTRVLWKSSQCSRIS